MPSGLLFTTGLFPSRPITPRPVTSRSEQPETRLAALTGLQIQVLGCCPGLKEFLPRAIAYLSQPGNDRHSDDVANFLMGSVVDLPHGLVKPHPAISYPTTKCLELLLYTQLPRISGKAPRPASTIDILRGIVAIQSRIAKESGLSALDLAEDRTLTHSLEPIPGTLRRMATPSAQFAALTSQHIEALVYCAGLKEFLPRAIIYLLQPGNDVHSEDVAHYLMGDPVSLPEGLGAPSSEISQATTECLEGLLHIGRSRTGKKALQPEPVIDTLRAIEAVQLRAATQLRAWASNLAEDRTLTHSLEPIPGTLRRMATPSAQFATQFAALTSQHIEALVYCAGLKEFLPRAIIYLLQPGNDVHSEDVAHYLMGDPVSLPEGLGEPSSEISQATTECLEGLLHIGRSRTGKKALQPEPVIDTLRAIEAVQLRAATQLRAWAFNVVEELPAPCPITLEEQFAALSIQHIEALVYSAELTEFLPQVITYLSQPGNHEHSKAVDNFLIGRQVKLPAGLEKPQREISSLATEGLKVLLATHRPQTPEKGAVPESTLNILRYLVAKQLGIQSGASTSNVAEDPSVSRRVDSSRDTSAFEQRFEALSEKPKAMLMDCEGLRELLSNAIEFLNEPGNRKHARHVAHYLMSLRTTLPTGLREPEEPISVDVKAVLKDLLRTSAHPLAVWNKEAHQKTLRKLDALALRLMLDSLYEDGAPPASGKASVIRLDGVETDADVFDSLDKSGASSASGAGSIIWLESVGTDDEGLDDWREDGAPPASEKASVTGLESFDTAAD